MKRLTIHHADRTILRELAAQVGWAERGGKAAGWQGQIVPKGVKTQRQMNAEGAGTTHWIGMPTWARGFGFDRRTAQRITLRAICGRPLGSKQYAFVRAMLQEADEILGTKNNDCPF